MSHALSALSLLVGLLGLQLHYWPTALPRLGPRFYLHTRGAAWAVRLAVVALGVGGYLAAPTGVALGALLISCVLAAGAGFFAPRRALPALIDPDHERADQTRLADQALVVGFSDDGGRAVAWPLEVLIPHHLVHDRVGDRRVVATW